MAQWVKVPASTPSDRSDRRAHGEEGDQWLPKWTSPLYMHAHTHTQIKVNATFVCLPFEAESHCSPAGLELTLKPASASSVLGLKSHANKPG